MMRVFKTRFFSRWMRTSQLTEHVLCNAVLEIKRGLLDADLGGGLIKKRVALRGRGKRAGARTLIATNRADRWYFLYGFEKNEQENISSSELAALKASAHLLLGSSANEVEWALRTGALQEICHGIDTQV